MKAKSIIFDYIKIILGTLLVALSLNIFLIPYKIAPGGVSGIATVIYYLWNIPVGVTMLFANIPLFIIGIKELGGKFGIRTFIATILLSFFTDFIKVPLFAEDAILASIYGGVLMGVGLGIVFMGNATTGGTDLFAKLLHERFPIIGMGWVMFIIDFLVVMVAAIVFSPNEALYAFICLFITAKMIDIIQEGINSAKAFFIISDNADIICQKILLELDRGATVLNGTGAYTMQQKNVILCVVNRTQVVRLKEIVNEIDPKAFMLVSHVKEVTGEGF